ncbi:hypothetical protein B7463_g4057, partial [Scytalidium lignicola]
MLFNNIQYALGLVKILYQAHFVWYMWCFVGLAIVFYYLSLKFNRQLRDIPGPFLAGFTGLWRLWDLSIGHSPYRGVELHNKYGKLVRVGPKHVSVGDPHEIATLYAVGNDYEKTAFYPIWAIRYEKKPLLNLFAASDEDYHKRIKRPVAHVYSVATLAQLEYKIDYVSKLFVNRLREESVEKQCKVDLGEWLQWYAFDVIGNLTFSRTLGFLEQLRDVDNMISSIFSFMRYASIIGQMPTLHKFLAGNPLVLWLFPAIETDNPAVNFAVKCLKEAAMEPPDTRDDFLSRFHRIAQEGRTGGLDGGAFGPADIVNHTSANVVAGSDTTAIALRAAIHNIITNPKVYLRLQQEIDGMDASGKLSDPVTEAEAKRMPYLQAIIKEALRIHPSVAMILERHVPPGGATICGKYLPAGTIVGIHPWVVARDKLVYGEDADTFRPERWIEADKEKLKVMERTSLAFGAGTHVCIGKHISLMEMSKVLSQLFREFDIELVGPRKDLTSLNLWFPAQTGLNCRLYNRVGCGENLSYLQAAQGQKGIAEVAS